MTAEGTACRLCARTNPARRLYRDFKALTERATGAPSLPALFSCHPRPRAGVQGGWSPASRRRHPGSPLKAGMTAADAARHQLAQTNPARQLRRGVKALTERATGAPSLLARRSCYPRPRAGVQGDRSPASRHCHPGSPLKAGVTAIEATRHALARANPARQFKRFARSLAAITESAVASNPPLLSLPPPSGGPGWPVSCIPALPAPRSSRG